MASAWPTFRSDLNDSFRQVFVEQPASLMYLVVFLIGLGGIGAWIAFWHSNVPIAIEHWGTYTTAIAATSAVDGMLGRPAASKSITVFLWSLTVVAIALGMFGYANAEWNYAFVLEILGSMCAIVVWIVASGRDERFKDDPAAPIGPNANAGLAGTLTGFKTE